MEKMSKGLATFSAALAAFLLTVSPSWAELVQLEYDGIRLNGEISLPDGVTIQDGVVLITHGNLAHKDMETIVALRDALTERGYASLAINLSLGLDDRAGFYDCAIGTNLHKHEDAVDEIGAWLNWLKAQGVGRVAVMGHSRGGNQTAWFAAEHDDPAVKAVVLLAPATYDYGAAVESYKRRYGKDLPALIDRARQLKADDVMNDVPFLQCEHASVTAESFLSYYANEPRRDTPSLLPKIDRPVLVIAGSADTVVPDLKKKVEPMTNDNLEFVEVAGADHFFLDLFMEDVADAVDGFLEVRW
jgi:pimeloyl-ACP methyl ester carboxylesterase